jgi:thioredoxin 1
MASFQELIQSDTPVLVDFYADWCGPCKVMKPVLEELKKMMQDEIRIVKVDVDKNQQAARSLDIQGIPTLILFRKGDILWRHSGVIQAVPLQQMIRRALGR